MAATNWSINQQFTKFKLNQFPLIDFIFILNWIDQCRHFSSSSVYLINHQLIVDPSFIQALIDPSIFIQTEFEFSFSHSFLALVAVSFQLLVSSTAT